MKDKLTSRKFWLAVAAFLASAGAGFAGIAGNHETLAMTGGICCVLSTAIYCFAEAYTDGKGIMASADTTQTVKTVTATTSTAKTVEKLAGINEQA